ncbi:MAG TPA: hypothetical protein PLB62_03710, partial [Candidatus Sumerlaeota bacterium]|nr:hypothetical protein [Candidatus Sumerlaeota bacterium]
RAEINRLVKELAKMGPDAIPAIENLLNNTDTNNLLRGELIKTLGSIGGHDAVRILLEEVRKTNSHIILFLATRTIKQAAKDVDLSEFLKEEMKNPGNFQVVSSLLSSMNKVEDPELLDNLKAMLANAQIPLEAKIQASKLLGDDGLHFLEETLKNTTDDFEITDILDAIEATGTVNAMNLLMILSQSEDYNDEIKALIGDSLTNLINNLADKDLSDSELEAVQEFLETRLKSGDESAFPSVVSGLANVNTDYARNLLRDEMTTRIKPNEVVAMSTALAQNYSNFDLEIPEDVSVNLFNIARKYMGTENPLEIRLGALNILNAIGGDEAQEILRGFENDGNPRIRDFVKRMLQ